MHRLEVLCQERFGRSVRVHNSWSLKQCHLLVPNSSKSRFTIYSAKDRTHSELEKTAEIAIQEMYKSDVKKAEIPGQCGSKLLRKSDKLYVRKVRVEGSASYWEIWGRIAFRSGYSQHVSMDKDSVWQAKCVYTDEKGAKTVKLGSGLNTKSAINAAAKKLVKSLANDMFSLTEQLEIQEKALETFEKMSKYRYTYLSDVIFSITG